MPLILVVSLAASCQVFSSVFGDNRFMSPHSHLEDSGVFESMKSTFLSKEHVDQLVTNYYSPQSKEDDRRRLRDEFLQCLMYLIDVEYSKYASDVLYSSKALVESGLSIGSIGLTAGATVTGHEATGKLLSGVATALLGTREAIDKSFFQEKSVPTVVTAMDAGRAEMAAILLTGLKKTTQHYPLAQGLRDVSEYYMRGTLVWALGKLAQTASTAKEHAEGALLIMRSQ